MRKLEHLAAVVDDLGTHASVSVSRPGASSVDGVGTATRSAATTFSAPMMVRRSLSQSDLLHLQEGDRATAAVKVSCRTELRLRDVLSFDGATWEVQHVESWSEAAGFWNALAVKSQQWGST